MNQQMSTVALITARDVGGTKTSISFPCCRRKSRYCDWQRHSDKRRTHSAWPMELRAPLFNSVMHRRSNSGEGGGVINAVNS